MNLIPPTLATKLILVVSMYLLYSVAKGELMKRCILIRLSFAYCSISFLNSSEVSASISSQLSGLSSSHIVSTIFCLSHSKSGFGSSIKLVSRPKLRIKKKVIRYQEQVKHCLEKYTFTYI